MLDFQFVDFPTAYFLVVLFLLSVWPYFIFLFWTAPWPVVVCRFAFVDIAGRRGV